MDMTTYALLKSQINSLTPFVTKGSVTSTSALPASADAGDLYITTDTGYQYVWDGEQWVQIGRTPIDSTLAISGYAADAKATGDALALKAVKSEVNASITELNTNLTIANEMQCELDAIGEPLRFDDLVLKSGYYVNNGSLATAYYSGRMRVGKALDLKAGDLLLITPFGDSISLYLVMTTDGGATYSGVSRGSTYFFSEDTTVYLTLRYSDSREITTSVANSILERVFIVRGYGNSAVISGEDWAVNLSNDQKVNFFNYLHLYNATINSSTLVMSYNGGNYSAWVKLLPNTVYNFIMTKKPNSGFTFALYDDDPILGNAGTNGVTVSSSVSEVEFTFETTDSYIYAGFNYATDSVTTYTVSEALQSIRIEIASGNVDYNSVKNARHISGNAATPLTLAHFSDIHADEYALKRIMKGVRLLDSNVDDTICTGDICNNVSGSISDWWDSSVLTCIGNHDTASYSNGAYNWTALSMADRDSYYIAPFEENWGITHTSGTSYYYKDYSEAKVRLIVMDAMLYSSSESDTTLGETQTAWLASLLADAITNSLHVMIAIHAPHGGATAENCSFGKYGATTMPTNSDCNTPQTVIDTVASAITSGLKFIGYICGHTHQDNVWDAEGDGSQLMFCITCADVYHSAQWANSDQFRSCEHDAYNLITIDTANTLVKVVRCGGANIDDHMRTRKAICFDYSTGTKVGEVL